MLGSQLPVAGVRRAILARAGYLTIQGASSALLFAVLARILDPTELGKAAAAFAIYSAAQIFSDFGLSQYALTEVPRASATDPERAHRIAAGVARQFERLALLTLFLVALLALTLPASARTAVLAVGPAAAASLLVSGAESLARAEGDVKAPLVLALASRLPYFALLPAVTLEPVAWWATLLFSIAGVAGSGPAVARLRRIRSLAPDVGPDRILLRRAVPLGATAALMVVATRLNVVILGRSSTLVAVGELEAAWRACQPWFYLGGAVGTATTPYASHLLAGGGSLRAVAQRGLAYCAAIGLAGGAALAFLGGPISVLLYGSDDAEVVSAMRYLAILLPVAVVAFYLQTALLIPQGRLRLVLAALVLLAVASLTLTALLAGERGAAGAAIALTIAEVASGAILIAGSLRRRRTGAGGR